MQTARQIGKSIGTRPGGEAGVRPDAKQSLAGFLGREMEVLLAMAVPSMLLDQDGHLRLEGIPNQTREKFVSFLITQAGVDQISFNGKLLDSYQSILAEDSLSPLLDLLFEKSQGREISSDPQLEQIYWDFYAQWIDVSPKRFVATQIQTEPGRRRLENVLLDEKHFSPGLRADLIKAIAEVGFEKNIDRRTFLEMNRQISMANYFNLGISEEEMTEGTRLAREMIRAYHSFEDRESNRWENYLKSPEKIIRTSGLENEAGHEISNEGIRLAARLALEGQEDWDPRVRLTGHLAKFWLTLVDESTWKEANSTRQSKNIAFLFKRTEALVKKSVEVGNAEELISLSEEVRDFIQGGVGVEGQGWLKDLRDFTATVSVPLMFADHPAADRKAFDQLNQFVEELHFANEMGEILEMGSEEWVAPGFASSDLLDRRREPGDRTRSADPILRNVTQFTLALLQAKRSLWYQYKQHKLASRVASNIADLWGGGDLAEIRKGQKALEEVIGLLKKVENQEDLKSFEKILQKHLSQDGALHLALKAAEMEGWEQVWGLGQTLLILLGTRGIARALSSSKVLQDGATVVQEVSHWQKMKRGFVLGAHLSTAENMLAEFSGEVRPLDNNLFSWFKDASATGAAMALVTPLASRLGEGLANRPLVQRWLARYSQGGLKRIGGKVAADGALETGEEYLDNWFRAKLDDADAKIGAEQARDIALLSLAGGWTKMGLVAEWLRGAVSKDHSGGGSTRKKDVRRYPNSEKLVPEIFGPLKPLDPGLGDPFRRGATGVYLSSLIFSENSQTDLNKAGWSVSDFLIAGGLLAVSAVAWRAMRVVMALNRGKRALVDEEYRATLMERVRMGDGLSFHALNSILDQSPQTVLDYHRATADSVHRFKIQRELSQVPQHGLALLAKKAPGSDALKALRILSKYQNQDALYALARLDLKEHQPLVARDPEVAALVTQIFFETGNESAETVLLRMGEDTALQNLDLHWSGYKALEFFGRMGRERSLHEIQTADFLEISEGMAYEERWNYLTEVLYPAALWGNPSANKILETIEPVELVLPRYLDHQTGFGLSLLAEWGNEKAWQLLETCSYRDSHALYNLLSLAHYGNPRAEKMGERFDPGTLLDRIREDPVAFRLVVEMERMGHPKTRKILDDILNRYPRAQIAYERMRSQPSMVPFVETPSAKLNKILMDVFPGYEKLSTPEQVRFVKAAWERWARLSPEEMRRQIKRNWEETSLAGSIPLVFLEQQAREQGLSHIQIGWRENLREPLIPGTRRIPGSVLGLAVGLGLSTFAEPAHAAVHQLVTSGADGVSTWVGAGAAALMVGMALYGKRDFKRGRSRIPPEDRNLPPLMVGVQSRALNFRRFIEKEKALSDVDYFQEAQETLNEIIGLSAYEIPPWFLHELLDEFQERMDGGKDFGSIEELFSDRQRDYITDKFKRLANYHYIPSDAERSLEEIMEGIRREASFFTLAQTAQWYQGLIDILEEAHRSRDVRSLSFNLMDYAENWQNQPVKRHLPYLDQGWILSEGDLQRVLRRAYYDISEPNWFKNHILGLMRTLKHLRQTTDLPASFIAEGERVYHEAVTGADRSFVDALVRSVSLSIEKGKSCLLFLELLNDIEKLHPDRDIREYAARQRHAINSD